MNARADASLSVPSWAERNRQWLADAFARLRLRLASSALDLPVPDTLEDQEPSDFSPALLHCARVFALTPFERELLLLAAGVELDAGVREAWLQRSGSRSPRPNFELALELLTQPHWDALSPRAPLRHWRLLEPEAGALPTQAALRIDERMLHFIIGVAADDVRLLGVARRIDLVPPRAVDATDQALLERIVLALSCADLRRPLVALHSETGDAAAQREFALAAAARFGTTILWIQARDLPADSAVLAATARRVDRELALIGALPVLAPDSPNADATARAFVGHLQSALLWLGPPDPALAGQPDPRRVLRFDLPAPDAVRTRAALVAHWRNRAGHDAVDDGQLEAALACAATQFRLSPAAADSLIARLDAMDPAQRAPAVWGAAREAARGGLDALALRLPTVACFDDLVLPEALLVTLRGIAGELRHRELVYREWGFGERHPRGQGLTALFAGESGTGKTMAAEAIAAEAGLDLYQVDLATLVSKYIGETEKNLKKLFNAAESSGAVLLFDEADALFGKRSEVRDSHDRYGNIEVSYLLQRVEAYRGLAILTTNMKSALDRAFLRRIRFVLQFPFPDAMARARIWRQVFPLAAPLATLDFERLGRLPLAGGSIRSIALGAAFIAAAGSGRIDAVAVAQAVRAEFAKLERQPGDALLEALG
ncbi:MAG TPA: ATP-binding protein [Ottowia sp.]|uniref:AAA family ATPase n=1 Tax=Ottowia sp. TaxID=1898956 RepID=UPI002C75E007|nr:ATP-binding protein [Ottowia sp.]HMN20307.1 ATP-binding protein [Ottowia sp.]